MKNLLLTYEGYKITNIGDYIQSLAAKQFLDKSSIEYYHRDYLSNYDKEPAKVIMNGWFTHKPENWPPSDKIIPLFVSFHINSSSYDHLLSEKSIAYLKTHEPIGCRDQQTADLLQTKGVEAYFSSCLTTTLGVTYASSQKREGVYIVDPIHFVKESSSRFQKYKFIFEYLANIQGVNWYIRNIRKHNLYDLSLKSKNITRYISIIRSYIVISKILDKEMLKKAIILTQVHRAEEYPSNEARFERATKLIKTYSTAQLVITSRIHCALPCLGLDTPVLFLKNADDSVDSTCRFKGLLEFMSIIEFRGKKIIKSPFKNKININTSFKNRETHKAYINRLVNVCSKFIK